MQDLILLLKIATAVAVEFTILLRMIKKKWWFVTLFWWAMEHALRLVISTIWSLGNEYAYEQCQIENKPSGELPKLPKKAVMYEDHNGPYYVSVSWDDKTWTQLRCAFPSLMAAARLIKYYTSQNIQTYLCDERGRRVAF